MNSNNGFILSQDVVINMMRYLPTTDMVNANRVCKVWHNASLDPLMWKQMIDHVDNYVTQPYIDSMLEEIDFHSTKDQSHIDMKTKYCQLLFKDIPEKAKFTACIVSRNNIVPSEASFEEDTKLCEIALGPSGIIGEEYSLLIYIYFRKAFLFPLSVRLQNDAYCTLASCHFSITIVLVREMATSVHGTKRKLWT